MADIEEKMKIGRQNVDLNEFNETFFFFILNKFQSDFLLYK